jgi:hypothetical protein
MFKRKHIYFKKCHASGMLELILASTLFLILAIPSSVLSIAGAEQSVIQEKDLTALILSQEGIEASKAISSRNYLNLESGDYGLTLNGSNEWELSITPDVTDDFFTRTITIEDVYRDGSGNIASSGTLDLSTKKILSKVEWEWNKNKIYEKQLNTYLSNWQSDSFTLSTCAELSAGTYTTYTQNQSTAGSPSPNCDLILGPSPGNLAAPSGAYLSAQYDLGTEDLRYNFIAINKTLTPSSSIDLQMRTADSISNLNSASWVGPDGTSSTYYSSEESVIELAPSSTGNRYLQLNINMTSDGNTSPQLHDLQIDFSL